MTLPHEWHTRRPPPEPQHFTREEKLSELKLELLLRHNVYPGRVRLKKMKQETADRRIAILEDIIRDYDGETKL